MAILQARMIDLINAAKEYQHALRQLIRIIREDAKRIQEGHMTPDEAFQALLFEANEEALLDDVFTHQSTIDRELYHFLRNKRKNELNQRYMEEWRAKQGKTRQKEHVKFGNPTSELSEVAQRSIPFRAEGQSKKGYIRKHTLKDPPPEVQKELDNLQLREMTPKEKADFERFQQMRRDNNLPDKFDPLEDTIPKGGDIFKSSDPK